ncbi:hypothetical protein G7K_5115-t1 [Saitoella complicata NRRL Y-17804]|uniref:Vacuolar membrane-associated protein IML1 n=1 Tax=Saitoella complicata (strain BCRC 22490 / CBS 7301 / JCM 7358 / NBRC 10748 / NRRL Y-17804) TaxID=698492 RepID=A0A0E9NMH8_SAICN|nr:hypothetical protein G7K_5115-t1 [Saitoella complicata NRRL Y-17804]
MTPPTLWVHDPSFSSQEIILNYEAIPNLRAGQLYEIRPESANSSRPGSAESGRSKAGAKGFYLFISKENSRDAREETRLGEGKAAQHVASMGRTSGSRTNLQISVSSAIANLFNLQARSAINIVAVSKSLVSADYVELFFRDQYISRSDMYRLSRSLLNTTIHTNQSVSSQTSIRTSIKSIYVKGEIMDSAYVTEHTKPIFRSESARYSIFIQMSREMWEFEEDGEVLYGKAVDGFLPQLFKRWKSIGAHHLVSIVLFTRVIYDHAPLCMIRRPMDSGDGRPDWRTAGGWHEQRHKGYSDFFRVVVDNVSSDNWAAALAELKKQFHTFPAEVLTQTLPDGSSMILGRMSYALQGPILEAINVAAYQFTRDYVDRDLLRTGISLVIVSPGTGQFEVDGDMLRLTTETLAQNGIAIDLVCVSKMPLHSVPLFKYKAPDDEEGDAKDDKDQKGGVVIGSFTAQSYMSTTSTLRSLPFQTNKRLFAMPRWCDISFWSRDNSTATLANIGLPRHLRGRRTEFVPRCKMHELQMMGIMENELSSIAIAYLHEDRLWKESQMGVTFEGEDDEHKKRRKKAFMDLYDDLAFRPVEAAEKVLEKVRKRTEKDQKRHADAAGKSLSSSLISSRSAMPQDEGEDDLLRKADAEDELSFGTSFRHSEAVKQAKKDKRWEVVLEERRQRRKRSKAQLKTPLTLTGDPTFAAPRLSSMHVPLPSPLRSPGLSSEDDTDPGSEDASPIGGEPYPTVFSKPRGTSPQRPRLTRQISKIRPAPSLLSLSTAIATAATATVTASPASSASDTIFSRRFKSPSTTPKGTLQVTNRGSSVQPIIIKEALAKSAAKYLQSNANNADRLISPARSLSRRAAAGGIGGLAMRRERSGSPAPPLKPADKNVAKLVHDPWQKIVNPSNPSKNVLTLNSHWRRWQHVFPRPLSVASVKWKSMCTPASLPLTTEYFPSDEELKNEFREYTYVITIDPDEDMNQRDLMTEMITVRLSQGFQIVVTVAAANQNQQPTREFMVGMTEGPLSELGSVVYLSMGNHIHRITAESSGYNIEVKRYVRAAADVPDVSYHCNIAHVFDSTYTSADVDFRYPKADMYNWNYVDQLLAGYEDRLTDAARYWRARFVLIPFDPPKNAGIGPQNTEELNDEELHLAGIYKLSEIFQKGQWLAPEERRTQKAKKVKDVNVLDLVFTTLDPQVFVRQELETLLSGDVTTLSRKPALLIGSERLKKENMSLSTLAQEMQGEKGIRMQDRRWHFRTYENVFIGSDFVNWLLQNFIDVHTREEAVEYGNELQTAGLFEHCEKRHQFLDGHYFYHLRSEYAKSKPSKGWFGLRKAPSTVSTPVSERPPPLFKFQTTDVVPSQSSLGGMFGESSGKGVTSSPAPVRIKPRIDLSTIMRYDVDPQRKSFRPEIVTLHYDRIVNPENCYHVRLEWLNVTSKLIEDTLQMWARTAEKYGLRLVEAPLTEISSVTSLNPLQTALKIKLALDPPSIPQELGQQPGTPGSDVSVIEPMFYQIQLLKHFGFILDHVSASSFPANVDVRYSWGKPSYKYCQYIHRSGIAFTQIDDDGQIYWLTNRIFASRQASGDRRALAGSPDPDQLRNEFLAFVGDSEKLSAFYDEASVKLWQRSSRRGSGDTMITVNDPSPEIKFSGSLSSAAILPGLSERRGSGSVKSMFGFIAEDLP